MSPAIVLIIAVTGLAMLHLFGWVSNGQAMAGVFLCVVTYALIPRLT
jgi:hypothetical protein